jgi:PAS domain S-box-containing protein
VSSLCWQHVRLFSCSAATRSGSVGQQGDELLVEPITRNHVQPRTPAANRMIRDRDPILRAGPLTIDPAARTARIGDRPLELTAMEFDLLAYLMANPGRVFSRDHLLHAVWHSTAEWQQPATVTEHIRRLRAKIETEPRRPRVLCTVRGAGYRLDVPGDRLVDANAETPLVPGTVIQLDGRIVRADEAAAAIFERDVATSLVGLRISDLVAPASRTATLEGVSFARLGHEQRSQLVDLERVSGPNLDVEVRSTACQWNGDRAQHLTLTPVRDQSAQLRRLVAGVLGDVADAVVITDLHEHVRSWNPSAERLYGWPESQVLGRHILDVIECITRDDVPVDAADTVVLTSHRTTHEQHVTRDGSAIGVVACTTLVRNDAGDPIAIVSVTRRDGRGSTAPAAMRGAVQKGQKV